MTSPHVRSYAFGRVLIVALFLQGVYAVANVGGVLTAGHLLPLWAHGVAAAVAGLALIGILVGRGDQAPAGSAAAADYLETVRTLAAALDTGDPFALGRSYRVAQFCLQAGARLGLAAERLCALEIAALLHDIGRTAIHRDVLLKPGRLDPTERETVRTHPQIGYDILRNIEPLRRAAEIIRAHHEQPDGRGYPRGLVGQAIPLESSIISAVAAFDAMTCDRPYRRALSAVEALQELREFAGSQFRADVVAALEDLHAAGELYAGLDLTSLERYSSGCCVSRAVEEHLSRHRIPWGGRFELSGADSPGAAATSESLAADIEIDLVSDGQLLFTPCASDRITRPPRAVGD